MWKSYTSIQVAILQTSVVLSENGVWSRTLWGYSPSPFHCSALYYSVSGAITVGNRHLENKTPEARKPWFPGWMKSSTETPGVFYSLFQYSQFQCWTVKFTKLQITKKKYHFLYCHPVWSFIKIWPGCTFLSFWYFDIKRWTESLKLHTWQLHAYTHTLNISFRLLDSTAQQFPALQINQIKIEHKCVLIDQTKSLSLTLSSTGQHCFSAPADQ